jgi:hypothetical protein
MTSRSSVENRSACRGIAGSDSGATAVAAESGRPAVDAAGAEAVAGARRDESNHPSKTPSAAARADKSMLGSYRRNRAAGPTGHAAEATGVPSGATTPSATSGCEAR